MHTVIFLVMIINPGVHSSWTITPMPNTNVCLKMLKDIEARGGRGGGDTIPESVLKSKPANL